MAQILFFPKEHFLRDKNRPLTGLMLKTLELAYNKQKLGISFGPKDLKGSVTSLIQRGLIASRITKSNGEIQPTWYVTERAIKLLEGDGQTVGY